MSKNKKTRKRRSGDRRVNKSLKEKGVGVWIILAMLIFLFGGWAVYRHCQNHLIGVPADTVTIETSKGTFVMKVYPTLAPKTVANFRELAESGFYDGLTWHRVEDWVVQTGDPTATGMGGSEKTLSLEIAPRLSNKRGFVGMARAVDPNSASSQFYILRKDALSLDGNYALFGQVVKGMDVIDGLEIGDLMTKAAYKSNTSKTAQ